MVHIKIMLVMLFWALTFIYGRALADEVPVITLSFFRFLIAALLHIGIIYTQKSLRESVARLTARQYVKLTIAAGCIFAYNLLFFGALSEIPAARVAVIIGINPVAVACIAALFFGDQLSRRKIIGIALSFLGVLIVVTRGDVWVLLSLGIGLGEIMTLGCVAMWVSYSFIGRSAGGDGISIVVMVSVVNIINACMLFIAALFIDSLDIATILNFSVLAWSGFVVMGALSTVVAFFWYFDGIRTLGVVRATNYINFVPLFAGILGWLLLAELPTRSLIIGGALIVLGVFIVNKQGN